MPAKKAAKPASAYHHGDLRQALLDAALAKVDEEGVESVSLAAIARDLGVSQAAPYRHFPDRDALLAAIAAEGFRAFSAALVAAAEGQPQPSALSRMCHAYVAFGLARSGLYRLMFDSPLLTNASTGDELKAVAVGSFNLLVEALPPFSQGQTRERHALRIWAALHGIVMLSGRNLLNVSAAATRDDLIADILGQP